MRKRIVGLAPIQKRSESAGTWLDLDHIATVEATSEDPDFPIESAFVSGGRGWRASGKGKQQIRIIFDEPVSIQRIHLRFEEAEVERTQEFAIRWAGVEGGPEKEIVRQQWNFSPAGSASEVEDYNVRLENVSVLELTIKPDLTREDAPATLAEWRIA